MIYKIKSGIIVFMNRRISVRGLAVYNGKLLCVRHKPYFEAITGGKPFWCLPGGKLEDGEALLPVPSRVLAPVEEGGQPAVLGALARAAPAPERIQPTPGTVLVVPVLALHPGGSAEGEVPAEGAPAAAGAAGARAAAPAAAGAKGAAPAAKGGPAPARAAAPAKKG